MKDFLKAVKGEYKNLMLYGQKEPAHIFFISKGLLKCTLDNKLLPTLRRMLDSYEYKYLCIYDYDKNSYKLIETKDILEVDLNVEVY